MKHIVDIGQTDYTVLVFIPDPASTDGSGKTGLVAADITVSGSRVETDNDVTVTDYTSSVNNLASLTAAHNDWGFLEVSSTLAPGLYRLDIADAIFATAAWSSVVYVMITTSAAAASPMEFTLQIAAGAAGGYPVIGTGTNQFKSDASANVTFANTSIATVTNLTNAPTSGDLTATMKASVNTEVLDVLNTDTFAEPGQEAPGATVSLVKKIGYLYKAWRNKSTQTATTYNLMADDATTVDQKATVSDDATTYTKGEVATGP